MRLLAVGKTPPQGDGGLKKSRCINFSRIIVQLVEFEHQHKNELLFPPVLTKIVNNTRLICAGYFIEEK
jgi:hypothetical protein